MDIVGALRDTPWLSSELDGSAAPSPQRLRNLLARIALRSDSWAPRVRHDPRRRWYELLLRSASVEVWLIGWWPGQWTPLHDHGGAGGALTVLGGVLTEEGSPSESSARWSHRSLAVGTTLDVSPDVVHRVGNAGRAPATSIHAYSPPGAEMRTYDDLAGAAWLSPRPRAVVGARR